MTFYEKLQRTISLGTMMRKDSGETNLINMASSLWVMV